MCVWVRRMCVCLGEACVCVWVRRVCVCVFG